MARAHAHSSTVMWDALSSLPPLRRGVWVAGSRQCTVCPTHAAKAGALPPYKLYGMQRRVGVLKAQLPGAMRMFVTCTF
jgi:hypothetical protein